MPFDNNPSNIGMVTIGAIQGVTIYTSLMPQRSAVLAANKNDQSFVEDLRHGEMMAGALTLGMGLLLVFLSGSMFPLWIALGTVVTLTLAYELTLMHDGSAQNV